jgi:hypothetical protein
MLLDSIHKSSSTKSPSPLYIYRAMLRLMTEAARWAVSEVTRNASQFLEYATPADETPLLDPRFRETSGRFGPGRHVTGGGARRVGFVERCIDPLQLSS